MTAKFGQGIVTASECAVTAVELFEEQLVNVAGGGGGVNSVPPRWLSSLRDEASQHDLNSALQFVNVALSFADEHKINVSTVPAMLSSTIEIVNTRLTELISNACNEQSTFGESNCEELRARLDYLRLIVSVLPNEKTHESFLVQLHGQASAFLGEQCGKLVAYIDKVNASAKVASTVDQKFALFTKCQMLSPGILHPSVFSRDSFHIPHLFITHYQTTSR